MNAHTVDRSDQTTPAGIPWAKFSDTRAAMHKLIPSVFVLPVVRGFFELAGKNETPKSILDVGATQRLWRNAAEAKWPGIEYRSLDIDQSLPHDYHHFSQIDRQFDAVTLFEVLEHLPHADGMALLKNCFEVCRPGGLMLASVPNVLTPGIQLEYTHRTSFLAIDLAAVLELSGFEVLRAARVTFFPTKGRIIHRAIGALHRVLQVDWTQCIEVVARRPA